MTRPALGKGIASLIQDAPVDVATKTMVELPEGGALMVSLQSIKTNPNQPRKIFKEKELLELTNSIKENGIIQPLIVAKSDKGFELIAGERRLKAAKLAGLDKVPVIIKNITERDRNVISIIENVQRSDLNCVEEALAYYQLMDEFKLTQEDVAKRVGKERSTIANFLRILKLPRRIIDLLQKEELSLGHAKLLVTIGEERAEELGTIAAKQKLSVRDLEKLIAHKKIEPKKLDDLDYFKQKLETHTGFRIKLKGRNDRGAVTLKYRNKKEFNAIYEHLLK